jgi:hypothetical protein
VALDKRYSLGSMRDIRRFATVALLAVGTSARALTVGYDVLIKKSLPEPVGVELAQYHSENFNGIRPEKFTENLLIYKKQISVAAGSVQRLHYTSASGGFWLRWSLVSPEVDRPVSGVLDLAKGEHVIEIK